jgi:predicted AAA+ superfamily ATPase
MTPTNIILEETGDCEAVSPLLLERINAARRKQLKTELMSPEAIKLHRRLTEAYGLHYKLVKARKTGWLAIMKHYFISRRCGTSRRASWTAARSWVQVQPPPETGFTDEQKQKLNSIKQRLHYEPGRSQANLRSV